MKKIIFIFLATFGLYAQDYVHNEVIVKFKQGAGFEPSARVSNVGDREDLVVLKLQPGDDVMDAVAQLEQDPNIEYVQPNYIYRISATPNDTEYASKLWGLNNTGQTVNGVTGTVDKDINAESAWELNTSCSGIIVSVLDTGVRYDHEDILTNMWAGGPGGTHGYDFIDNDTNPMDLNGHGSHISGIIGGIGNNSKGVTGVCWSGVKIMAVRVFDATGSAYTTDIVQGIDYSVSRGANIINASFNFYGTIQNSSDTALSLAISEAETAGVLIVCSAGNNCGGSNPTPGCNVEVYNTWPCNYTQSNILCVASLDQNFDKSSFSNYGVTSVDISAPGTNIYSLDKDNTSDYQFLSGTSMATPYVAGLAALVWANTPTYTYVQVKEALMYGGVAVSSMSGKTVSGNVINALGALKFISSPTGLTATVN